MRTQRPVYWFSGQFLDPQHLQQADAHHAAVAGALLEQMRPWFWGVTSLDLDENALAGRRLSVREARLRFQDGTGLTILPEGGDALLPSRSFREAWTDLRTPFTVYVGLPPLRASGNVAGVLPSREGTPLPEDPAAEEARSHTGRFLASDTDDPLPDRYALPHASGSDHQAPVRTLYYYPRLLWEHELPAHPDLHVFPLARLVDEGFGPRLDPRHAPPLTRLSACPLLNRLTRRLEARLEAFLRRFVSEGDVSPNAPATIGLVLRLQAAQILAKLRCSLAWSETAPWEIFQILQEGLAALTACLPTLLTHEADIPYVHEDPAITFFRLNDAYQAILRGFFPETVGLVHFTQENDLAVACLPAHCLESDLDVWLVLRSPEDPQRLLREGRLAAGEPQALAEALTHALPCLPLYPEKAPPGLPDRKHVHYLKADTTSPAWESVRIARRMGVALFSSEHDPEAEAPPRETGAQTTANRLRLLVLRG